MPARIKIAPTSKVVFREGEGEKPAPFSHAIQMVFHKGEVSARINTKRFEQAFTEEEGSVFHLQCYSQSHHGRLCLDDTFLIFQFRI